MRLRTKLFIPFAALILVILGITLTRSREHTAKQKREAAYNAITAMYSRDLNPGITRAEVRQYIYAHGATPEYDSEPDPHSWNDILVRLGDEPPPWYCSRQVSYLQLRFDSNERYQNAALKVEGQECM